ncbi:MAG: hypothetical protein PF569_00085 [Candidatus Woesearchaeota archaeon]|jgi:predicted component of type VI protein secretion system|nr:hypothetical protein [Candidatus Woesearchaeota archaeon]
MIKSNIKKISLLLLVLVLLGAFTGCSSSDDVDTPTSGDTVNEVPADYDYTTDDLDSSLDDEFITDDVEIGDLI